MSYITLKEYAIKNKISIFNTIKLVKNNKVESKTEIINGKEIIYIKDEAPKIEQKPKPKEPTLQDLLKEVEELKRRVEKLEEKSSESKDNSPYFTG